MPGNPKQRLVEVAIRIFAEKGYHGATISDVCKHAHANIAAVNYHFGSKENLFCEVLRQSFAIADRRYPISGGLPASAAPEERLGAFIEAMIRRGFDPGPAGDFNRIMGHMGTRRTNIDKWILNEVRRLEIDHLDSILKALLVTRSSARINQARINIMSLTIFPTLSERLQRSIFPDAPRPKALKRFIRGQIDFALAGLQTLTPSEA